MESGIMQTVDIPIILLLPICAFAMIWIDRILGRRSENRYKQEARIQEVERRLDRIEKKTQG